MKINIDKFNYRVVISELLDICIYDIDLCMELLFNKLGFNDDDEINVLDIDNNGNIYFNVNDKDYSIRIKNNNDEKYPVVYFKNIDGIVYGYQCIFREIKGYISLSVNIFKCGYKINKNIVNYEIGSDYVEYRVMVLDKILEFRISKPYKYINKGGYYVNYEVPYHNGIVNYLSKLDDINSILDIYNDLCVLNIGNDIYKYDYIDLRVMNRDEYDNYDVKELILLQEGNLSSLIVNRNGYDISFNNDRWMCNNSRLQVMFELSKNKGIVSYNTRINYLKDDVEYDDSIIYRDIVDTDREVFEVKKLVKKIINNRDGD